MLAPWLPAFDSLRTATQVVTEPVEALLPGTSTGHPVRYLTQRPRREGTDVAPAHPSLLDESRALEVDQVLGDGLLRHAERLRECSNGDRARRQAVENRPAGGMRKGRQLQAQRIHNLKVVDSGR